MTQETGLDALRDILSGLFRVDPASIQESTTAADIPGWDSLQMVNIILSVQRRFGITFRNRDIDEVMNVGDLAALIDRATKA
ncbi:hypothetical protein AA103196_0780 [Ameyamaea chiangmaiensis NBRC 103196]|uniref:Acyl carrier protein n=1 Tax=Ameyamaea chiangmaiensis TaxID=442969 RepID=A0A850PFK7_9PROT|nr:acyl carrier protein [Ameyamaea chiangmaiensis]NVN41230.1 acyl carrier protein [Ameyamaea chiangmaiensis]GBQ64092.1 hypothetical protein AA103196_0780 [Ameyamaea chiangmaiensis NBRC 103196]